MLGFTNTVTLYHQTEDGSYIARVINNASVKQSAGIQPSIRRVAIPGRHSSANNALCVRILGTNPMRYCKPHAFDKQDPSQYTAAPGDVLCIGQGPQQLQSVSQLYKEGFAFGMIHAVEDFCQGPLGHVALHGV